MLLSLSTGLREARRQYLGCWLSRVAAGPVHLMDRKSCSLDPLAGLDWFEVDRADVLAAKDAALEREGAQPRAGAAGNWR